MNLTITPDKYQNIYTKLNLWIPKIVECLDAENADEHVVEFLEYSLNFFYWIADKVDKMNVANKHKSDVCNKIQKNIIINKEVDYENKDDSTALEDYANYIPVWIKNNFDIDINKTELSTIKEKNTLKLESVSGKKDNNSALFTFHNIFNKELSSGDFEFLKQKKASVDKQRAQDEIQEEITKGKIYIYRTKPKWNPILKNVLALLLGTGFLLSILWTVFAWKELWMLSTKYGEALLSLASIAFFIYTLTESVKNNKNDNFKYLFNKSLLVYQFLFICISSAVVFPEASNIFGIFSIIIQFLAMIINSYGSLALNPEKNDKLINDLKAKYESDKPSKHKYQEVD